MLSLPDTSMEDYIDAEQAAERLKDGFAAYFQTYDALLTPVLPVPAYKHGQSAFVINGQTVDATYMQGATVPLNVTGLPGVSFTVRHKQRRHADQRASGWKLAG